MSEQLTATCMLCDVPMEYCGWQDECDGWRYHKFWCPNCGKVYWRRDDTLPRATFAAGPDA